MPDLIKLTLRNKKEIKLSTKKKLKRHVFNFEIHVTRDQQENEKAQLSNLIMVTKDTLFFPQVYRRDYHTSISISRDNESYQTQIQIASTFNSKHTWSPKVHSQLEYRIQNGHHLNQTTENRRQTNQRYYDCFLDGVHEFGVVTSVLAMGYVTDKQRKA